jgi:hypothetical protein
MLMLSTVAVPSSYLPQKLAGHVSISWVDHEQCVLLWKRYLNR